MKEPRSNPTLKLKREKQGYSRANLSFLGPRKDRLSSQQSKRFATFADTGYFALDVRTEHVHIVVSNSGKPERMMNSFKAYSTKALREAGLVGVDVKPWSRHGSTRYLWTDEHVAKAVDYVVNGQGGELPEFD